MSYTDQPDSIDVRIENGLILFDSYQLYKKRAEEARDYLLTLDVRPESEQECKRIVATARRISDQLNDEKIRVKKSLLEPYSDFEHKVKEIITIITEGENVARDKLKAIDDQRREEKKEGLRRIWESRCKYFEAAMYLNFEDFLQDRHLNKTTTVADVEKEMITFLREKTEDIQFLSQKPLKDEYIEEYTHSLNVVKAMGAVDRRHTAMKAKLTEPYMVIRIIGKADILLAKQVLKDVNYKVLEEN